MGIRINSSVIYGVEFTAKEVKAYEKFMQDKSSDWLLMRYVEATLDKWNKRKNRPEYDDHLLAAQFMKIDRKTQRAVNPYKPFWAGLSKNNLKKVEDDLFGSLHTYMNSIIKSNHVFTDFMWWPQSYNEIKIGHIFGYRQERRYASEIDYALIDILDLDSKNKVYVVKGNRPWECGVTYDKKQKIWYTFNDTFFIPPGCRPKDSEQEFAGLNAFKGTKAQYLKYKKALWDKYHGTRKPYKNYYGEGWNGSDFYFYPVDMLFKFMSQHIPEIKYDVMRLEKLLCFNWS